jgi:hypothetical protein
MCFVFLLFSVLQASVESVSASGGLLSFIVTEVTPSILGN